MCINVWNTITTCRSFRIPFLQIMWWKAQIGPYFGNFLEERHIKSKGQFWPGLQLSELLKYLERDLLDTLLGASIRLTQPILSLNKTLYTKHLSSLKMNEPREHKTTQGTSLITLNNTHSSTQTHSYTTITLEKREDKWMMYFLFGCQKMGISKTLGQNFRNGKLSKRNCT